MPDPRTPRHPTPTADEPVPGVAHGWIAPDVAEEHPGLALLAWTAETDWPRRSPAMLRDRLSDLSTRVDGPAVLRAHEQDAPAAHRRFLHRVGRTGDDVRSPVEVAYHDRIEHGGFPMRSALQDVLLVVLLETGVPIWAVDAAAVRGELGIRRSLAGELRGDPQGAGGGPEPPPEPVVVDAAGVVAELGREPRDAHRATRRTARTTFFCARVPGLADLRVEEAVWFCRSLAECGTGS